MIKVLPNKTYLRRDGRIADVRRATQEEMTIDGREFTELNKDGRRLLTLHWDASGSWFGDGKKSKADLICPWDRSDQVRIMEAMERWGGSFVQALAAAMRKADSNNLNAIAQAFTEIITRYYNMSEEKCMKCGGDVSYRVTDRASFWQCDECHDQDHR